MESPQGDTHEVPNLKPLPSSVAISRVPAWRLADLVHRACPVCRADQPEVICRRPDQLLVSRCRSCGMIYLPQVPCPADLDTVYADYARFKASPPPRRSWWPTQRLWWANSNIMILEQTGGLRGQRLCDVGCSYGSFLQLARSRRAQVFGVDLDANACSHVQRLGIPAGPSLPADRPFDIVTAFQFIEHLPDPAAWVRSLGDAMKPDARLLLAMPNGGEFRKVGPTWVGFRGDLEHLNYFDISTLSRLLADHGFYVEQYWETLQAWLHRTALPGFVAQVARYVVGRLFNHPFYIDGRYVLTALARKVG